MFTILAPGPSLTAADCERVRHLTTIAVGCAFKLAPWADHLAANDRAWWKHYPEAHKFAGEKWSGNILPHLNRVDPCTFGTASNSGVLALDLARNLGAKEIVLLGFDMHGSHFFGSYQNGLTNTSEARRQVHQQQFAQWARANRKVSVVNATVGSKLEAFPLESLP